MIEVWGDVRCPWCWIGHRRLQRAVQQVGDRGVVSYRSFLLEPRGPERSGRTVAEAATLDWGMTAEHWARRSAAIRAAGDELGLDIRIDTTPVVDSRPAHRLLALARHRGIGAEAAREVVFDALLRRNSDISDPEVLRDLSREIGIGRPDLDEPLATTRLDAEVADDHAEAVRRGVHAVPALATPHGLLTGDRSVDELVAALRSTTTD